MPLIKICGITDSQAPIRIARMGADMLGFVFAESRRRVSIEKATEIISSLDNSARPALVGVFVNEEPDKVNRIAAQCGLDIVQLSGDESWDYCRQINYPLIQVLHITPEMSATEVISRIEEGYQSNIAKPFICMLDARFDNLYGGGGKSFDWEIAGAVAAKYPVMIAGGLSAANAEQLITAVKPLGVDASSLLETDGKKDMLKVEDFIKAVRSIPHKADDCANYLSKYLLKR